MIIEINTSPKEEEAKILCQGIIDFNYFKVPGLEPMEKEVKFHTFARNQNGEILGGIRAVCYWNTMHIELLWLAENTRGKGIGKSLLAAAESFAKENNCEKVFVETTSWQAKPFYEKVGYILFAKLNDRPKGFVSYYLTKNLK